MDKIKSAAIITLIVTVIGGLLAGWQIITGIQDRAEAARIKVVNVHNDSSSSHSDLREKIEKKLDKIEKKLDKLLDKIYRRSE